ncbi:ferredoxin [Pluralibacter gergoviae]|nr:ferredoxin [Pluralibacter gergoviae]
MANSLTNFFIADTITQTHVHNRPHSTCINSVNENGYNYNTRYQEQRTKDEKNYH